VPTTKCFSLCQSNSSSCSNWKSPRTIELRRWWPKLGLIYSNSIDSRCTHRCQLPYDAMSAIRMTLTRNDGDLDHTSGTTIQCVHRTVISPGVAPLERDQGFSQDIHQRTRLCSRGLDSRAQESAKTSRRCKTIGGEGCSNRQLEDLGEQLERYMDYWHPVSIISQRVDRQLTLVDMWNLLQLIRNQSEYWY
jgi:hypothetical protein